MILSLIHILWVIVTVGCIGDTARNIVNAFRQRHPLDDIDGIFTFNHPFGCSQMGQDHRNTVKILQDIVTHPNAGGVLVLGLGCENNQLKPFYDTLEPVSYTHLDRDFAVAVRRQIVGKDNVLI